MTHRWMYAILCVLLGACTETTSPDAGDVEAKTKPVSAASADDAEVAVSSNAHLPGTFDDGSIGAMSDEDRRDLLALADDIATQGDARALALAAALRTDAQSVPVDSEGAAARKPDDAIESWLDDAMERGPDDVTAIVIALYGAGGGTARRKTLIARWRTLEPRNMLPMMLDSLPEEALFEAAASADHYDSHYDDALREMLDILARSRSPALARLSERQREGRVAFDMTIALGYQMTSVWPRFSEVSAPCRSEGLEAHRREQCRRIARTLRDNADVLIAEIFGAGMTKYIAESSDELARAKAARREAAWLETCVIAMRRTDIKAVMSRHAQILLGTTQITERQLMRRLVIEGGLPPTPPQDWKSGDSALLAPARDRQAADSR